jgi:hypothetical protein
MFICCIYGRKESQEPPILPSYWFHSFIFLKHCLRNKTRSSHLSSKPLCLLFLLLSLLLLQITMWFVPLTPSDHWSNTEFPDQIRIISSNLFVFLFLIFSNIDTLTFAYCMLYPLEYNLCWGVEFVLFTTVSPESWAVWWYSSKHSDAFLLNLSVTCS